MLFTNRGERPLIRMSRLILREYDNAMKATTATVFCLVAATLFFIFYQDAQKTTRSIRPQTIPPLIVAWTNYFSESLKVPLLSTLTDCAYHCDFIDRDEQKWQNRDASAYVIHGRDINISELPSSPSKSLHILMLMESPYHTGNAIHKVPLQYFNATITYRRDSRYFHPYGYFVQRTGEEKANDVITKEQLLAGVKKKKRGSLIFVSNCKTPSKREDLIKELGRFTPITVRGACERWLSVGEEMRSYSCKEDCDEESLIATHRFYISFENSICNDYITEKFFMRISQMLIPIVVRRRIYEDAGIPRGSFIALDDFGSMKELGDRLRVLQANDTEYLKYFEWTTHFRKPAAYKGDALCKLCEDIYRKNKFHIDDIVTYYKDGQCEEA